MPQSLSRGIKVLISSLTVMLVLVSPIVAALEVGEKAPDFALQSSDGNTYTLSQFIGEKPVVIAFFPKAFTGG